LLRLHVNWFDYTILAIYFTLVITIGVIARRAVATSEDFLLSGRSLPAWITGLAFISANLGAIEILGMAANGAQYGLPTVHLSWGCSSSSGGGSDRSSVPSRISQSRPTPRPPGDGPGRAAGADTLPTLQEVIAEIRTGFPDVPVSDHVVEGPGGPALLSQAADATLLVVGARTRGLPRHAPRVSGRILRP
jgi:Sodium:solute symporter family